MNLFRKLLKPNQIKTSPLLLCEDCSFASEMLFVVKKMFLCGECKESEKRRRRLKQAEKEFNQTKDVK